MQYFSSLKPKLIYVFRINDVAHKGCLKIGETTFEDGDITLQPNSSALNKAAKKRIDQYTQTAAIDYDLLYTELTIFVRDKMIGAFNDKEVHDVLLRSGVKRKVFDHANNANEWFETDLETVKNAIAAVKAGKKSLHASEISTGRTPIDFRPEQREAIDKTLKQFKKSNQMLWNAKMRFGKTLSALQVVKKIREIPPCAYPYSPSGGRCRLVRGFRQDILRYSRLCLWFKNKWRALYESRRTGKA